MDFVRDDISVTKKISIQKQYISKNEILDFASFYL